MERFVDKVRPQVGETWRTDEVYMPIKDNHRYLFAMLDSETRYWLAKMVASHEGNDDVAPMFAKAKQVAGRSPRSSSLTGPPTSATPTTSSTRQRTTFTRSPSTSHIST